MSYKEKHHKQIWNCLLHDLTVCEGYTQWYMGARMTTKSQHWYYDISTKPTNPEIRLIYIVDYFMLRQKRRVQRRASRGIMTSSKDC